MSGASEDSSTGADRQSSGIVLAVLSVLLLGFILILSWGEKELLERFTFSTGTVGFAVLIREAQRPPRRRNPSLVVAGITAFIIGWLPVFARQPLRDCSEWLAQLTADIGASTPGI